MTNEKTIQEEFTILSPLMKIEIHEDDAIKFKDSYGSINVSTFDPRYPPSLAQKFPIEYNSFRKTVLDNLSKKKIIFSFIENANDIGFLLHFSDSLYGPIDRFYQINNSNLELVSDASQYKILTDSFKNKLGKYIAQKIDPVDPKPTEMVSFEMTDVVKYLLDNNYELPRTAHFQVLTVDFEMLQYTAEITNYNAGDAENKGRISIGSRISYSYFENGTIVTGKLPLYDIGTLHP